MAYTRDPGSDYRIGGSRAQRSVLRIRERHEFQGDGHSHPAKDRGNRHACPWSGGGERTHATPGGPTPTPQPAGVPPTATPGSSGASTPLPGTTPLPTVGGVHIGMVTRPQSRVTQIQTGANNNDPNYTFYLNPTTTLNKTLPAEGFTQGFTVVKPTTANPTSTPYNGPDGRPLVKYYVRYQGQIFTVQVVQPGIRGPKGIWVIATIFQGQQ